MSDSIHTVAVYGAGSWGTALALQLARAGSKVLLWDIDTELLNNMQRERINQRYIPGVELHQNISIEHSLERACTACDLNLLVIPSHVYRDFLHKLKPFLNQNSKIAWASKGLEPDSGLLLHQVINEVVPEVSQKAVISGPTFAVEVAENLPTAVTVAAKNEDFALQVARALHSDKFRAYTSHDIIGVELGGALKNVLAIATGLSDGLGFGANSRAALITRGLAEIMRLGLKLGGEKETFMGLAGLGDLVLTCTDDKSRNRRMGLNLAAGLSADESKEKIGQSVEGVRTAREAHLMALKYAIECPIIEQVYNILYHDMKPQQVVSDLLSRDLRSESI
ncbi:MAG: NAD(P)-dependent glycerol-3-phosphate dehydrogenase [Gammaproteobacteria bacterium]|nr:NAD(P)-dependent glycerol-3-phosphate dehydrogenase [Gammaproteobacteria bacterium]